MNRSALGAYLCAAFAALPVATRLAADDGVVDHAVIAHQNLAQLHFAIQVYQNDNEEQFDDPLHLLGYGGLTPESFWHPGDDDPMPSIIDNSAPNTPNSAQVSFLFRTGWLGELAGDEFLIWDASPVNNAGQFTSVVTVDGAIETIPPVSLPFHSNVTLAQRHLTRLGRDLWWYAHNHDGYLPDSLLDLYAHGSLTWPRSFWNPGDSNEVPTAITSATPDAPNSAHISFDFPAAGGVLDELPPLTILLTDNTPDNNLGLGIYVLRSLPSSTGGRVEFMPSDAIGDRNADDRIDLADWAGLQACYTGWGIDQFIEDDACRVFDFNGNSRIETDDVRMFLEALTGPAI